MTDTPRASTTTPADIPAPVKEKVQTGGTYGHMHVLATFNNTIVTFTDSRAVLLTTAPAPGFRFFRALKGYGLCSSSCY